MRLICSLYRNPEYKRLMLYSSNEGVYLFFYDTDADVFCVRDDWFESLESAYIVAEKQFGVHHDDWQPIPDPLSGCQNDFIQPVRVNGRVKGEPEWGRFEVLINGEWIEYKIQRAL